MGRRGIALCLAAVLTLGLTSCGTRTEESSGAAAGRLHNQTAASEDRVRHSIVQDGRYYAGTDGRVTQRRTAPDSEWEKLGREIRESWDKLKRETENAAEDTENAAEGAAKDAEHAVKKTAEDTKDAVQKAQSGLTEAGRNQVHS